MSFRGKRFYPFLWLLHQLSVTFISIAGFILILPCSQNSEVSHRRRSFFILNCFFQITVIGSFLKLSSLMDLNHRHPEYKSGVLTYWTKWGLCSLQIYQKYFNLAIAFEYFFFFEKERDIEENPIGSKESSEIWIQLTSMHFPPVVTLSRQTIYYQH